MSPPRRLACGLLVGLVALVGCAPEPPRFERVVLIVVDTLRRDHLGHQGGPAKTPAIDALARRGASFENAAASFHQTTMSMAALFTGRVPALEWIPGPIPNFAFNGRSWCGLRRFGQRGDACVPPGVPTLAEQMRAAGLETLGVVSNELLHAPAGYHRGFDVWEEVGHVDAGFPVGPRAQARARQASAVHAAAERVVGGRTSDRFFLYVHYMEAHDWWLRDFDSYAEGVEASDAAVGELLALLEREGLLDGALVVLTGDHGEMLASDPVLIEQERHFGNPSFEPVLDVPLVVAPAVELWTDRPIRTDQLAGLLLDGVGARSADEWRGTDLLADDEVFTSETAWRTYRRGRWKSAWPRDGAPPLLFDLETGEAENVAEQHPRVVAQHEDRIGEIVAQLAAGGAGDPGSLSPEDLELLRALGYAE